MTSLLLGDLNDYLEPSQECIKTPKEPPKIQIPKDTDVVTINLTDCLACSGCITSAETILVSQQTYLQLYDQLSKNQADPANAKLIVVSISPQTCVALADRFNMTPVAVFQRLTYFFKVQLGGVDLVVDTAFSQGISLLETAREFVDRVERAKQEPKNVYTMPMLTSTCPGWICYVEKRYPEMLNYLSTTRSPQHICGSLVKKFIPERLAKQRNPNNVFHVSIMPCYDRKLEASRSDFYDTTWNIREIDCVITTGELLQMINSEFSNGGLFSDLPTTCPLDDAISAVYVDKDLSVQVYGHAGTGAGGYIEFVLEYATKRLFPEQDREHCIVRKVKNADYIEYSLMQGEVALLRFASIYGFRNIQTFMQKRRLGKLNGPHYDFIEIMACPGACLYGGGQPALDLAPPNATLPNVPLENVPLSNVPLENVHLANVEVVNVASAIPVQSTESDTPLPSPQPSNATASIPIKDRKLIKASNERLEYIYKSSYGTSHPEWPTIETDPRVQALYEWVGDRCQELFHTRYHAIHDAPKKGFNVQW